MAAKEKTGNAFVETIKTIVYALLIAGVFRTLFFQPFWIPSGSMKETLLIGDFLFVNKMAYGYSYASCPSVMMPRFGIEVDAKDVCGVFDGDNTRLFGSEPERGDVVVFRHPVSGRDYIKRLIGLPGDKVQITDGVVSINGTAVELRDDGVFEEVMDRQGPQGMRPRCENGAVGQLLQAGHGDVGAHRDAVVGMQVSVHLRDRGRCDPIQRSRCRLQHRDLGTERSCRCRRLAPDQAAADHQQ